MTTRYQKRHYEDVAALLAPHGGLECAVTDCWTTLCAGFADLFAADNPGGFDRERFLAACGLE